MAHIEIRKYIVADNATHEKVLITYAANEQAALDEYAAIRSGYDTMTEMARSATFREASKVYAYRAV